MFDQLSLVVAYNCGLRCSYCPVEKSERRMPIDMAKHAVKLFLQSYPNLKSEQNKTIRRIRFSGTDPLCRMDLVRELLDFVESDAQFRLTTNGIDFSDSIIDEFEADERIELVISVDGRREDHLMSRKTVDKSIDSYSWFNKYLKKLRNFKRQVTVNMVIVPENAAKIAENAAHIFKNGFYKINLLPAYYVLWSDEQLANLELGFNKFAALFDEGRQRNLPLDLINIENYSENALYTPAIVVDTDGEIYDNDIITSRFLTKDKAAYSMGNILKIQTLEELDKSKTPDWSEILSQKIDPKILESTRQVDLFLSELVYKLR